MKTLTILALVIGIGLSLLLMGFLSWSPQLISSGAGFLTIGIVSYVALRMEYEIRRIVGETEARFYKEFLRMMLEEVELYDDRVVFFAPSSMGGETAILVSHKKAKPPKNPGRIPRRLFFEYNKRFFARFPSIFSTVNIAEISKVSNIAELEALISSIFRDLGLATDVKAVEKPDGTIVVDVTARKGVLVEDDPGNFVLNLAGSIVAEGLDSMIEFLNLENVEGSLYRIYFRRL